MAPTGPCSQSQPYSALAVPSLQFLHSPKVKTLLSLSYSISRVRFHRRPSQPLLSRLDLIPPVGPVPGILARQQRRLVLADQPDLRLQHPPPSDGLGQHSPCGHRVLVLHPSLPSIDDHRPGTAVHMPLSGFGFVGPKVGIRPAWRDPPLRRFKALARPEYHPSRRCSPSESPPIVRGRHCDT